MAKPAVRVAANTGVNGVGRRMSHCLHNCTIYTLPLPSPIDLGVIAWEVASTTA